MAKQKRRRSSKGAGGENNTRGVLTDADKEIMLAGAKDDAKQAFEEERKAILSQLPDSVTSNFGQVGFCRFSKQTYGVLLLSPYDVPPGIVRTQWLELFEKMKGQDRLDSISHFVYWYGSSEAKDYYGFIGQKEFVPYEKGLTGPAFKPYEAVQRKLEKGKKLTKPEQDRMKALKEMEDDIKKEPSQRKRGILDFQEGYDMLTLDDLEDTMKNYVKPANEGEVESEENEEEEEEEEEGVPPPAKKRKRRASKVEEEPAEIEAEPDEPMKPGTKKKGRKRDKHVRTKKPPQKEENAPPEDHGDMEETVGATEGAGDAKSTKKSGGVSEVGGMEEFGDADEEEEEDDDDEKDEDFREGNIPEDDDQEDDDWDSDGADKKNKTRKTTAKAGKSPGKEKPFKKKQDLKPKTQKVNSRKNEADDFERCEEAYLSMIHEYEDALVDEDLVALDSGLNKLLQIVTDVSVPFLQLYLVGLVKQTKAFLKRPQFTASDEFVKKYKLFKKELNDAYTAKNKFVAKGFKMPERKSRARTAAVSREVGKGAFADEKVPAISQEIGGRSPSHVQESDAPSREYHVPKKEPLNIPRKENSKASPKRDESQTGRPQTSTATTATAPPKPERKTFSLGSLGRMMQQDQSQESGKPASSSTLTKLPAWLTGPVAATDKVPDDDSRSMALEFLREMASHFPDGKVDVESTALSFEKAIFEYATKPERKTCKAYKDSTKPQDQKWVDVYWERVHAIIGCVCGKKDPGTLMQLILNGDFATPNKVVGLDDQQLRKSYEGHSLV